MKLIGITGTVGKTSTCLILHKYLVDYNYNVISFTTSGIYENHNILKKDLSVTCMIDEDKINEYIKDKDLDFIIFELTAEAGYTKKYEDKEFEVIALSNFIEDIVQSFPTQKDYKEAKLRLFNNIKSKFKVINNKSDFIESIMKKENIITFGNRKSDIKIRNPKLDENLRLGFEIENKFIQSNLLTKINIENIECVIGILKSLEIFDLDVFENSLSNINIPGRLEHFREKNRNIIIDSCYNGKTGIYPLIKKLDRNRVISVVCTYNFPSYTKITSLIKEYRISKGLFFRLYSKLVIFTKYGRYNGNEEEAIQQLTEFVNDAKVIENRYEAIRYALKNSNEEDIILLIGKGDEESLFEGDMRLTDKQMVLKILEGE